uniref:Uncharacterized protein n=1 Tax=viral metagenome TaxID=1070528 RepID=A0A6C0HR16_9ZZZZ
MFGYRNYIISNTTGNVSAPNYGPYDSQQYPSIVSNLNNGNLNGKHPTPASFSIMDTGNDYVVSRDIYRRVFGPLNTPFARQMVVRPQPCGTCDSKYPNGFKGKKFSVNSKNYIAPISSRERTNLQKAANIGKSSLKEGLPIDAYYTNRSYDKSFVNSKIKSIRSSGCIPPKKCSSIYNRNFTPSNAFTQSSYF